MGIDLMGKEKLRYVLVCLAIIVAAVAYVYAFSVAWSSTVTINATSPTIKVYWDQACTNPVTSVDFGNVQRGGFKELAMYIKNEGEGQVKVYWNSTVGQYAKIHDWWGRYSGRDWFLSGASGNMWYGSSLVSGGVVGPLYYQILVDPDISLSSYSWTLNVGSRAA